MVDLSKVSLGRPQRTSVELYIPYSEVKAYECFNDTLEELLKLEEKPERLYNLVL